MKNGAALPPDEVDERAERRQHRLQSAAVEMGAEPRLEERDDAESGDGRVDREVAAPPSRTTNGPRRLLASLGKGA